MSTSNQITVASDLIRVHLVITRALEVIIENIETFRQKGYPEASLMAGFVSYVRSLLILLHSHHTIEDDIIFPYFQEKLPDSPFDLMYAQHEVLIPALAETEIALQKVAASSEAITSSLNVLLEILTKIRELWHTHMQLEEAYLTEEKIASVIDREEQTRLCLLMAEEAQKHTEEDYLLIPFVLYNLSGENRALVSEVFPKIVIEQLVPIDWKKQWEPMLPFFLP